MDLVTGATGHLGNVLVRDLSLSGKKVRALVLPGENTDILKGHEIEFVEGNILDRNGIKKAMDGVENVYHLAAMVSIEPGRDEILHQVNVDGTQNMLDCAKEAGVKKFVYTSSIHALTRPPEGVTIDESLPFDTQNPAGAYDRTKAEASLRVLDAVKNGMDAVIVCPTGVIGPFDYRRSEMGELILDFMNQRFNFTVNGFFDFVDVRDVVKGHILASQKGIPGETYILGGERIGIPNLCEMVQSVIGKKGVEVRIPLPLAIFSTYFTTMYYSLTKTRAKFTRYALETVVSNSQISSEKARTKLGYQPRTLQETIVDTVHWWQEHQTLIRRMVRG